MSIQQKLMQFKAECPPLKKEAEGFGYNYVTIDKLHEVVYPLMEKIGLDIQHRQEVNALGQNVLVTVLYEVGGDEKIENRMAIPDEQMSGMTKAQSVGAALTYLRRYMISVSLNVLTEDDNDAAGRPQKSTKSAGREKYSDEKPDSEKKWLDEDTKEWEQAVTLMEEGETTVNDLRKHYKISRKLGTQLNSFRP